MQSKYEKSNALRDFNGHVERSINLYKLVCSIYPTDSWDNFIDVKHRAIVTQTHFQRDDTNKFKLYNYRYKI